MTNPCKHEYFVRYVLDDSPDSHAQRDGLDNHGRPYRDVPMQPRQAFWYAATIGSTFETRTLAANCRDCGADVLTALREKLS